MSVLQDVTDTALRRTAAGLRQPRLRWGVQSKFGLGVLVSILASALVIAAALDIYDQNRMWRANVGEAETMVRAASLAFSQASRRNDQELLEALVHELQSRSDLNVVAAYVMDTGGRVVAHSGPSGRSAHSPPPALLQSKKPERLSQVIATGPSGFEVVGLLKAQGRTQGALVVRFSTRQLPGRVRSELAGVFGAILLALLLSGLVVLFHGRNVLNRLVALRHSVLALGHGGSVEPAAKPGSDEIAFLTRAFDHMRHDLDALREKDRIANETICRLGRELEVQSQTVDRLREQLVEENADLRRNLDSVEGDCEFFGRSRPVRRLLEQAGQVAPLPINVLIFGESGTGKELLANFLHRRGDRAGGPFVKVNCAALPATLIESELFGHEKGAFTGATGQRKGKFELAQGGILFLDEVGELSLEAQAKLLRALQQGEVQRLGGSTSIYVDVRLVAATNRNLADEVARGAFREDLYYRLKVIELYCPTLRERLDDVPVLAQHFIEYYQHKLDRPVVGISPSALQRLHYHLWPGNVRELEHAIARAVAFAETRVLGPEDFAFLDSVAATQAAPCTGHADFEALLNACGLGGEVAQNNVWERVTMACERICVDAALKRTGSQKQAAALLDITPTKMHRLIRKHGLKVS